MKVTVERAEMLAGLKRVKPAVSTGTSLPVLHSVHLAAIEDGVRLTATDLDLTIRHRVAADADGDDATIPARFLESVLGSMSAAEATITVEDGQATVTCGEATATTQTASVDDWPKLDVDAGDLINLDAATVQLIRSVVYACSQDPKRPGITGVRIEGRHAVATDSFRLAVADLGDVDLPGVTIPAEMMRAALAATETNATLLVAPHSASWSAGPTTWTTRTIAEEFPVWQRLVDGASATHHVEVPVDDLLDALKLMGTVQSDDTPTRLSWDGDWATVSRRADDSEVVDRIPMKGDADTPGIAFSTAFLGELLRNLPDDMAEVRLGVIDELKPATVVLDRVTHLLMPIRVSGGA